MSRIMTGQPVVLRRVDPGHAHRLELRAVGVRDDAADHDRRVDPGLPEQPRASPAPAPRCEPERIERPDHVDVLVAGRGRDLGRASGGSPGRRPPSRRRGPRPRSARRRSSGRRGRACPPAAGSGAARLLGDRPHPLPDRFHLGAGPHRDPRRRPSAPRYSPNTSRNAPGPLADRAARLGERDRRGHEVLRTSRATACRSRERRVDRGVVARRAPLRDRLARARASTSGSIVTMPPCCALSASGDGSVSVNELTPTTFSSPDSMRRTRSAWLCTSRPFISSIIANEPPPSSTHCSSTSRLRAQLRDLASRRPPSPRTGRRTRAGPTRTRAPAGCAATTAGPTASAGRAPRSNTAAASRGPARPSTASRRASRARCAARCSRAAPR